MELVYPVRRECFKESAEMDVLQDTLIGLAEIAIALAGFSAIVVMLRRGTDGR